MSPILWILNNSDTWIRFVGAAAAVNISQLVKFRSFESRRRQEPNLPIWQVVRVALTHPGLLPPIQLGSEHASITYISGELHWNNPSKEMIREFEAEWKREGILCFVSIGTGYQGVIQVDPSCGPDTLQLTAEKMAMACQRVTEEIAYRFQGQRNYFRLNVEQGLQVTDDRKPLRLEDVIIHTKAYLDSNWADTSVNRLVYSLLRADTVFPWQTTRDRFQQIMKTCLRHTRLCVDGIQIDSIKQEALEAVFTLEVIQVRVVFFLYMNIPHTDPGSGFERRRVA